MNRRTEIQLGLLAIGLIVWGVGQRNDDTRLTAAGLGLFAVAFILRFFKPRDVDPPTDPPADL